MSRLADARRGDTEADGEDEDAEDAASPENAGDEPSFEAHEIEWDAATRRAVEGTGPSPAVKRALCDLDGMPLRREMDLQCANRYCICGPRRFCARCGETIDPGELHFVCDECDNTYCKDCGPGVTIERKYDYVANRVTGEIRQTTELPSQALHRRKTWRLRPGANARTPKIKKRSHGLGHEAYNLAHEVLQRARSRCGDLGDADLLDRDWGIDFLPELFDAFEEEPDGDWSREVVASGLRQLAEACHYVIERQPTVSEVKVPCKIYGDLHGQARDMLMFFRSFGFPGDDEVAHLSYVFNGDFVDRGTHQLEVLAILFALKVALPSMVWLNRGNHEDEKMSEKYDFRKKCQVLGEEEWLETYEAIQRTFNQLPLASRVGERIIVLHGGIGDGEWSIDSLRQVQRPLDPQALRAPENSWLWQLLWSDPVEEDKHDRGVVGVHPSPSRGERTRTFGWNITEAFCARNDLDMVVRSHQFKKCGFGFDVMHDETLIRVFSARDYFFKEGKPHACNDGTILHVALCDGEEAGGALTIRPQVLPSIAERRGRPAFDEYKGWGAVECGGWRS